MMEIDLRLLMVVVVWSIVDIDPETLEEVLRDAQRTPVPVIQPNTKRREK
jgi:hypothetical protein